MQFHVIQFPRHFRVYRRKSAPEYKIVAEHGLRIGPDGLPDGAGLKLNDNAWDTVFETDGNKITANDIDDSSGKIRKNPVTFSLDEWEPIINANSQVMNIHIPRGDRITTDTWFDSIARAFTFFETVMKPSLPLKACVCFSWMFDSRLQSFLPENSGLMRLQEAVHLFPLPTTDTKAGLYFVFGDNDIDINSAPADTSLRRGMIEHIRKGRVFTGGSMIYFRDELLS